jgi:hypothetical protein
MSKKKTRQQAIRDILAGDDDLDNIGSYPMGKAFYDGTIGRSVGGVTSFYHSTENSLDNISERTNVLIDCILTAPDDAKDIKVSLMKALKYAAASATAAVGIYVDEIGEEELGYLSERERKAFIVGYTRGIVAVSEESVTQLRTEAMAKLLVDALIRSATANASRGGGQ